MRTRTGVSTEVASPVVSGKAAFLVETINMRAVARWYQKRYGIDIAAHLSVPLPDFAGLYRCTATSYEFFDPPSLAGLPSLYDKLQEYPWYYQPWKWEHDVAERFIEESDNVLEVGCGVGFFLKRLSELHSVTCTGLELNAKARAQRVFSNVLGDSIDEYASRNPGSADVVCAFQVLEHIYEVEKFLSSCCTALASGGRLIVSVPNNDANLRYDKRFLLNMPPHHVGRWGTASLSCLVNHFPLNLEAVVIEPLQDGSVSWHTTLRHAKTIGYVPAILLAKANYFGARKAFDAETVKMRAAIADHTIACVFRKT